MKSFNYVTMRKTILFSFTLFFWSFSFSQTYTHCYSPILTNLKERDWSSIDSHLKFITREFSDSVLIPITLSDIGEKTFEIQDFDKMYKYSKLMIAFDHKRYETKFQKKPKNKWDYHVKYLVKSKLKNWGHFYLATAYLNRNQYDSCLIHLDSSYILNYVSLPRKYTYNVTANLHTTLMKSICYEAIGEKEKARKILLPYLLLDNFEESHNFYNHKDLIIQYKNLISDGGIEKNPFQFSNQPSVFEIKIEKLDDFSRPIYNYYNDSISVPSGWESFQRNPIGKYILIEDKYVPYYVSHEYYNDLNSYIDFNLPAYLKTTELYKIFLKK